MRTSFIMALLAAAAIVPSAAFAQDWHHGDGGHGGRNGGGGGQPQQHQQPQAPQRQAPQSQPAQMPNRSFNGGGGDHGRVYFQGGRPPQFQGQPQVQQQQPPVQVRQPYQPNNGGWQQQGDHRGGGNPQWQGGDHHGGGNWQGQGRGQQPGNGGGWQGQGRGNGQANGGGWSNGRPDRGGDWRNGRPNNGGDWRNGGRNQGGGWNRNWRQDNRYNWNDRRNHNREIFHLPRYYAPYGWDYGYRRFSIGYELSSILYEQNYWIDDPYYYGLPEAYGPYRWVRYYNDALLVDIYTGEVVDTVYGIFW